MPDLSYRRVSIPLSRIVDSLPHRDDQAYPGPWHVIDDLVHPGHFLLMRRQSGTTAEILNTLGEPGRVASFRSAQEAISFIPRMAGGAHEPWTSERVEIVPNVPRLRAARDVIAVIPEGMLDLDAPPGLRDGVGDVLSHLACVPQFAAYGLAVIDGGDNGSRYAIHGVQYDFDECGALLFGLTIEESYDLLTNVGDDDDDEEDEDRRTAASRSQAHRAIELVRFADVIAIAEARVIRLTGQVPQPPAVSSNLIERHEELKEQLEDEFMATSATVDPDDEEGTFDHGEFQAWLSRVTIDDHHEKQYEAIEFIELNKLIERATGQDPQSSQPPVVDPATRILTEYVDEDAPGDDEQPDMSPKAAP